MDRKDAPLGGELIELGAASVETKGSPFSLGEPEGGIPEAGLADE
jgi:hypothetical protein